MMCLTLRIIILILNTAFVTDNMTVSALSDFAKFIFEQITSLFGLRLYLLSFVLRLFLKILSIINSFITLYADHNLALKQLTRMQKIIKAS